MLHDLTRHILDQWETHFPGSVCPGKVSYLNATGSIEGGTTTFLAFSDRCQSPHFAVKVARRAATGALLKRESELLARLATYPIAVSGAIPRSICGGHNCGPGLLVQSFIAGRPMPLRRRSDGMPDVERAGADLRVAATWLAEMNSATRRADADACDVARQRLLKVVREFRELFALTPLEGGVVDDAVDALAGLLDRGVVVQHGDFSSQNVLFKTPLESGPTIGVVDWTWSEEYGLPVHDLLFLVIGYFLQLRVEPGLQGFTGAFRQCLLDDGSTRDVVFDLLRRFCGETGIEWVQLQQLIVWFLIERTVFDHRMLVDCSVRGIWPRWTLALAAESGAPLSAVEERQYWFSLFRTYVAAARSAVA